MERAKCANCGKVLDSGKLFCNDDCALDLVQKNIRLAKQIQAEIKELQEKRSRR